MGYTHMVRVKIKDQTSYVSVLSCGLVEGERKRSLTRKFQILEDLGISLQIVALQNQWSK